MCGMPKVDQLSYAYTGGHSISRSEQQNSAQMRIGGDNEAEGDEKPCGQAWGGSDVPGSDNERFHGRQWGWTGMVAEQNPHRHVNWGYTGGFRYHYVGGLEEYDNHGQDGVNVLYLDWHAEFDGRSWPSPLGAVHTEDWAKYQWGDPITSTPAGVDGECTGFMGAPGHQQMDNLVTP